MDMASDSDELKMTQMKCVVKVRVVLIRGSYEALLVAAGR